MADDRISLTFSVDTDEVKAAETSLKALEKASERAAGAAEKVEGAAGRTSQQMQHLSRGALQTSQAFQDVAQGGLASALNNVDGVVGSLVKGFGGAATTAATVSGGLLAIGTACLIAAPYVKSLLESFTKGPNSLPEVGNALERTVRRLEEARGALKALAEGWDGSAESLAEYNRLTAESERLEKQANVAREAAAGIEAQRRKERQGDAGSMKAASEAVEKAGGIDKVVDDLTAARPGATNAASAQLDQARKDRDKAMAAVPEGAHFSVQRSQVKSEEDAKVRAAEAAVTEARRAAREAAADLAGKALGGDQAAIMQMDRSLPGKGFNLATAENVQKAKDNLAAGEEQAKRDKDWRAKQEKIREERRKADAKVEQAKEDRIEQEMYAYDADRIATNDERMERLQKEPAEREKAEAEAERTKRQELQERTRNVATAREGRERGELQQFAAANGVDIPSEQLGGVLDSMRGFMAAGANPMEAALGAMRTFVQANQATLDRMQAIEREFQMLGGYAQQQFTRARQQQPINGSLLGRGQGFEALGEAAISRADVNPLAARIGWLSDEVDRTNARRPRTPSLLTYGDW